MNNEFLPSYQECVDMCNQPNSPFYEVKNVVDGYPVSVFNYRLASHADFKPRKAREMRGICFVFNKDNTLFNRFILLEKFFNVDQTEDSMFSVVKEYKIRFINNKEDGSIASFIKLPNGKVVGKSKVGFDNDQSNGINYLYNNVSYIKSFVDDCLSNNIVPIFEYVSPSNRIVIRYLEDDLILLRLRDNNTGKHLDISEFNYPNIAEFEDKYKDWHDLKSSVSKEIEREGVIVQVEDDLGQDLFFKIKTEWYIERHGLLTTDLYREHVIIGYILDDKIDDVLGQVPEDEKEAHDRINKIIDIVKDSVKKKSIEINQSYDMFVDIGGDIKSYALKHGKHENFSFVMSMVNKNMDPYDLAKKYIRNKTNKLFLSRDWLMSKDKTLFFKEIDDE